MKSYALMGQRSLELRQFRTCAHALRHEFDTQPERATVDLFELIRDDEARC